MHVKKVFVSINFLTKLNVWSTWNHTCRTLVVSLSHVVKLHTHSRPQCRPSLLAARSWSEEKVALETHDLIGWNFDPVQGAQLLCFDWYRTNKHHRPRKSAVMLQGPYWQSISGEKEVLVKNALRLDYRFPVSHCSLQTLSFIYFFSLSRRYFALLSN